jgi:hypothetical protein
MPEYPYPDPIVQITDVQELARDLVVIPNRRVKLVPNIGSSQVPTRYWSSRPGSARATLARRTKMTEFADIKGGRIAYDVTGQGPLAVLSHGIGDHRQVYRFLAPRLAQAGYRVAR